MADKEHENVTLPKAHVKKVRENKKKTGVSISAFICQAIDEKLHHQENQKIMDAAYGQLKKTK